MFYHYYVHSNDFSNFNFFKHAIISMLPVIKELKETPRTSERTRLPTLSELTSLL